MKREHSTLSELIADLRQRAKLSHVKVGTAIHRSRWTSQHYEEGRVRPPPGYVAFIARAAHTQSRADDAQEAAQELLHELNAAITLYYGRDDTVRSWEELCALAERWVEENRQQRRRSKPLPPNEMEPADKTVTQPPAPPGSPGLHAPCWHLRAATPDFVGRETERERLVAALRGEGPSKPQAALVCIRGLGGAGKTELAYRAAQELAGDFPNGQLLLELRGSTAPLRPEEALARVVQAFAPQQALPQPIAELRSLYRTALRGRRVLIVADDARDAAQLRELLPPAGSALLITSRWRFALDGLGDANLIELGGLEVGEAVRLVLSISPRIGAAASELAALCGSLPLALRIAGGRLASDRTLRVEHFMAQLRDEHKRLAALEGDESEQSVSAALNLSYRALDPQARAMLAQLGVYPSSFSRDALPGVVILPDAAPEPTLDQVLSQLHRAGLVELDAQGERVWLHDLVRAFAVAQLDDREATHRRHAATYAWLARRLGELAQQRETLLSALAIFDAERAHIELGIRWAIEHADEPESAQILVDYVVGMPTIGMLRCHPSELLRPLYTAGRELGRRLQEPPFEAVALNNLGALASQLGDETEAERLYKQAQALVKSVPDSEAFNLALQHNLAKSYMGQGDFDRARGEAETLLQMSSAKQNDEVQIRALILLGVIERRSGDPERAVEYGEEALLIAKRSGHPDLKRLALATLANATAALSATASADLGIRATSYATEALAIAEQLGDKHGQAEALTVLGNVAMLHGNPQLAVQRHKEALDIAGAQGDTNLVAATLINLGDSYRELREGELAAAAYAQGVQAYEALNNTYGLARAYWHYGDLVVHQHTFADTSPTLEQAKRAARLWERAVELEQAHNLATA
jgi:tetratricopeptide (TPR) repeat protein